MAIPFQVFDITRSRIGFVWCVRCEDWIPVEEAFGAAGSACDPHVMDHIQVYFALRRETTDALF